ncbi:unnamed protein product [Chrysoparadoxa australica]
MAAEEGKQDSALEGEAEGHQEGGEHECSLCVFMKAGPCAVPFSAWEGCIDEAAEGRMSDECLEITAALKECVSQNAGYHSQVFTDVEDKDGKDSGEAKEASIMVESKTDVATAQKQALA